MQNGIGQVKGQGAGKEKRKVGAALLRLQQSYPEDEEDVSLQDFFRELRRSRSREYMEQVRLCMELSQRIAKLKEELKKGQNGVPEKRGNDKGENPEKETGNREAEIGPGEGEVSPETDTQKAKPAPAWLPKTATGAVPEGKSIEWKGYERNRLEAELDCLEWELKQQQKQLYEKLPKGDPYLGSVFLTENKAELLRRGFISGGVPYEDVEELLQICNAVSEQECRMLAWADAALREFPSPFVVEVYLHAVCKVFEDGSTQLIRG